MTFEKFLFYVFAAVLLFAAARVVTARNPIHSAMFLVLSFFSCASLWVLLEAEFLAITLVLVYVGAVMVLFLFVVMMMNINVDLLREGFIKYLPVGALVAIVSAVEMGVVLTTAKFGGAEKAELVRHGTEYSNTAEIGKVLYTDYLLAFELASVLLLIAIVAAIALTMRKRPNTKSQNPGEQVQVKKEDRLRVVKMDVEEKQS